ncbi:MAG: MBL fold metallo-hydrolase [Calditrichaceae bacterium]|nr:MBL fold metallo-hydrolase [Calditrichaceae bacterium]MBN2708000.1 MBL fold metallo-hydrolase [Calditrichaceae bacterium]RQV95903.1 MAG: MBL fold metallo-hydrolase [Calditrichota bacterium]
MKIHQFTVGPFEMNSFIVSEDDKADCFIIDAGDEEDRIIEFIEKNHYNPVAIINTHGHIDHTRRAFEFQSHFNIPFWMGEDDQPLLESLKNQGIAFGMDVAGLPHLETYLTDGQKIKLGRITFTVLHTPGHSPGSMSLYTPGHIFVGDVLFKDSIGRTDLYGGDYKTLMKSIREKILPLPDETIVYPGHGPTTTIGREKKQNPFLNPTANPF